MSRWGLRYKTFEVLWPDEWNAVVDALDELSKNLCLLIGVGKRLSIDSGLYKSAMPYTGELDVGNGLVMPVNANLQVLSVYVVNNSLNNSSYVIVRKNESETNLKVTIPAEGTGNFSNSVDELMFNAGDRLDFVVDTTNASSGTIDIGSMSIFAVYLLPT